MIHRKLLLENPTDIHDHLFVKKKLLKAKRVGEGRSKQRIRAGRWLTIFQLFAYLNIALKPEFPTTHYIGATSFC